MCPRATRDQALQMLGDGSGGKEQSELTVSSRNIRTAMGHVTLLALRMAAIVACDTSDTVRQMGRRRPKTVLDSLQTRREPPEMDQSRQRHQKRVTEGKIGMKTRKWQDFEHL